MQNQENDIKVREDLHELKQHGSLDYPVASYHVNLLDMYLNCIRWHWHEEIEFTYIAEGAATFMVHDTNLLLQKGDALFINQNTLHSIHAKDDHECKIITIVFHPDFLFGYGHSSLSSQYLLPLINDPDLRFRKLESTNEADLQLITILQDIFALNNEKDFGFELETKGKLIQLWLQMLSWCKEDVALSSKTELSITPDEMRAKEGITYIAAHYAEPITLQDIANSIHISKSECCRCFKRCLRVTPFEYLLKYRIYAAVSMIAKTDSALSISDIAMQTGFNSSSYFNKIFKKYIGCTPSEYKRSLLLGKSHDVDLLISRMDSHVDISVRQTSKDFS